MSALRILLLAAVAAVVLALSPSVGSYMHESDQASLLHGGLRLMRGEADPFAADFYNYDKQFGSYWTLAIVGRLIPKADPVLLGNAASFFIFWAGLACVIATGRMRSGLAGVALFACLVSPCLWVHSPFLASTFLASGFLFFAWSCWQLSRRHRFLAWPALALMFWAVGCRADVVLILPALAWLAVPPRRVLAWFCDWRPYAFAFAAVIGLAVGRVITAGGVVDVHQPFFYPKVYAAYFVFGLGVAVVPLSLNVLGLLRISWMRRARRTAIFYAAGAFGLLIPGLYYSVQMFSPRYWAVTVCAQILFLVSSRGSTILKVARPAVRRTLAAALFGFALLPVFFGLRFDQLSAPAVVVEDPTMFPSADGWIPMGGMLWYSQRHRNSETGIDHNQATWLAALSADLMPTREGKVNILTGGLSSYIQLAAELQGRDSVGVNVDAPEFYTDLRQLLRANNALTGMEDIDQKAFFETHSVKEVSPTFNGYSIVRVTQDTSRTDAAILKGLELSRLFGGAEFEPSVPSDGRTWKRAAASGRSAVVYSKAPFVVKMGDGGVRHPEATKELGFALKLSAAEIRSGFSIDSKGAPVEAVVSRLPEFMDLQNL